MDKEILITEIINLIEDGNYGYEIEDYLKIKGIDANDFNDLIKTSELRIYEKKLKTVPIKNTIIYASFILLTIILFIFFYFYLPKEVESENQKFLSIFGSILTSICISYAIFFHGSWKKQYVEENYFQKMNYSFLPVIAFIPCIILYFMISNKFDSTAKEMLIKNKVEAVATVISGGGTQLTNLKGQNIDFSTIVVEFTTTEGQKIIAYESVNKSQLQDYYIGQEINIIYSKTNPQNMELLAYDSDVRDYIGSEERRIEINDLFNLFSKKESEILGVLNNISYGWEYNSYKKMWMNNKRNISITINTDIIKCISDDFFTFPRQLKNAGFKHSKEDIIQNENDDALSNKVYLNDTLNISIEMIKLNQDSNKMISLTTIIKKNIH